MSEKTNIQWAHSTVNPVMGCDGCELLSPVAKVKDALAEEILKYVKPNQIPLVRPTVEAEVRYLKTTQIFAQREQIVDQLLAKTKGPKAARARLLAIIGDHITCYAARLHANRGGV